MHSLLGPFGVKSVHQVDDFKNDAWEGSHISKISVTRFAIASTDPEHVAELLSRQYGGLLVKPRSAHGKISVNSILGRFGDLRYSFATNSGGLDILPANDDRLAIFTFPLAGGMVLETSTGILETSSTDAVASGAFNVRSYCFSKPRKQINIALDIEVFHKRLITLFGVSPHRPLTFETVATLSGGVSLPSPAWARLSHRPILPLLATWRQPRRFPISSSTCS